MAGVEVEPDCTCGFHIAVVDPQSQDSTTNSLQDVYNQLATSRTCGHVDASFLLVSEGDGEVPAVAHPLENYSGRRNQDEGRDDVQRSFTEFMEDHVRVKSLLHAMTSDPPPSLCIECGRRVELALKLETDRLTQESQEYQEAVHQQHDRLRKWNQALKSNQAMRLITSSRSGEDPDDGVLSLDFERVEQAFRKDIYLLEETCRQLESELADLNAVGRNQALLRQQLDLETNRLNENKVALELEARSFDRDQDQLQRMLELIDDEASRLVSTAIKLPAALYDLKVDRERGLRYPLINDLRLAYRPKGDVQWEEIQVAWSLAARLLLVIGTVFKFRSENWRLVPLSNCAKLIFYQTSSASISTDRRKAKAIVFNMGHPKTNSSRAMMAWNALLHQVTVHVQAKVNQLCQQGIMHPNNIQALPFPSSSTTVGEIELARLSETDDASWSKAVHLMASNLLWLSECASLKVLQHVELEVCLAT